MEKEKSARVRASMKYNATNVRRFNFSLNRKTDVDIIEHLEKQDSMSGYLKRLIREDMQKNQ